MTRILTSVARLLARINETIGVSGRNIAGVFLMLMTAIVMAQVFFRYGLNNSLSWTEELSKTLMVWTAFLVAPWAYRHGANVSIDLFREAMPALVQRVLQLFLTLVILWIVAVFFRESLEFVARGMQSMSATLPVRTGLFYLIVPVSFAALFLTGCELLLRQCLALAGVELEPIADAGSMR